LERLVKEIDLAKRQNNQGQVEELNRQLNDTVRDFQVRMTNEGEVLPGIVTIAQAQRLPAREMTQNLFRDYMSDQIKQRAIEQMQQTGRKTALLPYSNGFMEYEVAENLSKDGIRPLAIIAPAASPLQLDARGKVLLPAGTTLDLRTDGLIFKNVDWDMGPNSSRTPIGAVVKSASTLSQ
jgi:hypothetical protein